MVVNEQQEYYSLSFIISDMQIIAMRMTYTNKMRLKQLVGTLWLKINMFQSHSLLGVLSISVAISEMKISQRTITRVSYILVIPTLGIYPLKTKT